MIWSKWLYIVFFYTHIPFRPQIMCSFFMSKPDSAAILRFPANRWAAQPKRFDGFARHTWLQSFGLPAADSSTAQATLTQDLQQVAQMFPGVW